ncbi:hypothetical protein JW758_00660 [Candidatus Peregrinibacteria bacterium]|nr:hypothetical protein [Candidatus Peregrinibacteria bacterium]
MIKKKAKSNKASAVLNGIWNVIKFIGIAIWKVVLHIIIFLERSAKTIMIFIISISFLILSLSASFYLLSSSFGVKDSPAFQELRDKITRIYVLSMEDELSELENKTLNENN